MAHTWTVDQLWKNKRTGMWFAYPDVPGMEGRVYIHVYGDDPDDVVEAANRIERAAAGVWRDTNGHLMRTVGPPIRGRRAKGGNPDVA